jgi:hypothetical protein
VKEIAEFVRPSAPLVRVDTAALPQRRIQTVKWSDARADSTASYCVKGLIPKPAVVLIVGESGSGKTFLAAKLATHIAESALGKFFGRRVANGYVVIVASENPSSVETRLAAWRENLNVSGANLEITKDRIDVVSTDGRQQLFDTLSAIALEVPPGIAAVFIDTAACAMAGADENTSEGMGALISAAQWIRDELNCAVVIVHHLGKNKTQGARGHSSLHAACDVVMEVSGTDGARTAKVTKSRDGVTGDEIQFETAPHRHRRRPRRRRNEYMRCRAGAVADAEVQAPAESAEPNSRLRSDRMRARETRRSRNDCAGSGRIQRAGTAHRTEAPLDAFLGSRHGPEGAEVRAGNRGMALAPRCPPRIPEP